jgi:hypothetical protein
MCGRNAFSFLGCQANEQEEWEYHQSIEHCVSHELEGAEEVA